MMGAVHYLEEGWRPLPLPAGKKHAPPSDWTGGSKPNSGKKPTRAQLATWAREYPQGNLAISPPKSVIGIDVDAYDGKSGAETVAAAEQDWGQLPPTWISTSRDEGSGIRWFRIPEGLGWPGKLPQGGGVELIRWDHRYAVVAPSVHPEGREYHWVTPGGNAVTDEFPTPDELPMLPPEWVQGLTGGKKWAPRMEAELDDEEVQQWIEDRGDTPLCTVMERTLRKHLNDLRLSGPEGGAHEQMLHAVWAVLGDSAAGHSGVVKALTRLRAAFKEATKGRRSAAEFASEWKRAKAGGVQKVVAEGEAEDEDPCELHQTDRAPKERKRVGATDVYLRNDSGNGARFAARYRNSVRYVAEYNSWMIWSDRLQVWVRDTEGQIKRMAIETVGTISQEAEYEEDPKTKSAIRKFANSSGNNGKLNSMLEVARDLKGMTVPAAEFDSNPETLVCGNGTLELGDGVRLRPSRLEDYSTISTGVPYRADSRLPEWDKFLARFQPDAEVRDWLQRLAGYSLLGRNPRRLMVVAFGPTSTGKTTFANTIAAALGEYAASTTMTVFRDNQDERPRADLVRVLNRRFVYAEEASASWHLHPDQIKRITGGAPITARVPYAKDYLEVRPSFTPWLLTNSAPTIEGADAALWRRIMVVPFEVQIPETEEDPAFAAALESPEGKAAVLCWVVEGYRAYLADPESLSLIPTGAAAATARFRAEVSDFAQALYDLCEFGEPDDYRAIPADLFQAYTAWCDVHQIKERDRLSGTKFGRELTGLGYDKRRVKVDGKVVWYRTGIRLREGWQARVAG